MNGELATQIARVFRNKLPFPLDITVVGDQIIVWLGFDYSHAFACFVDAVKFLQSLKAIA